MMEVLFFIVSLISLVERLFISTVINSGCFPINILSFKGKERGPSIPRELVLC